MVDSVASTPPYTSEAPSLDQAYIESEGGDDDCLSESGDANEEDETEVIMNCSCDSNNEDQ